MGPLPPEGLCTTPPDPKPCIPDPLLWRALLVYWRVLLVTHLGDAGYIDPMVAADIKVYAAHRPTPALDSAPPII
jgi:hypothetical protein